MYYERMIESSSVRVERILKITSIPKPAKGAIRLTLSAFFVLGSLILRVSIEQCSALRSCLTLDFL